MDTNVFGTYLTASGAVTSSRTRLRGVLMTGTGTVAFKNGGSGGTTLFTLNSTGTAYVMIPANGVIFSTDCYATIAGLTAVTAFYG